MTLLIYLYGQVEVSCTDHLLVHSSPTECGVSEWTFSDEVAKAQYGLSSSEKRLMYRIIAPTFFLFIEGMQN